LPSLLSGGVGSRELLARRSIESTIVKDLFVCVGECVEEMLNWLLLQSGEELGRNTELKESGEGGKGQARGPEELLRREERRTAGMGEEA